MMAVLIFEFVQHMPVHYKEAISLQELWGRITSSIPLDVAKTMNVGS
jgi:hypothetical protein